MRVSRGRRTKETLGRNMYIYQCTRCKTKIEFDHRRSVPFRSPHEDYRHMVEGMAPRRCNGRFARVWTKPNLNGLETRRK